MTLNLPLFLYIPSFECERVSKRERAILRLFISFSSRHRTNLRSSSPVINSGQISATRNGANQRGQVFLSFKPQESPVRGALPGPISEPPRPKAVSPPMKPAPPKPLARRYLTRSGGRPLQKRARVESSEPIDLTEPSPVPSPCHLRRRQQSLSLPLLEPQIPAEIAPEEIIRRPMLTQPPIEGNLDCRARPFHSELCFDIATFQLRPSLHSHSTCCEDTIWSTC
ncbi:hypothetical protein CK203_102388 [Vitis vinifera]|uniref:Uncharacterized protein n=1 Tax=Vitis vinifera TaxID=29760 RepID=A0A438D9G0_VITVI|nr:hypothetical protein CK203_102388 [Vitis vinifera]